MTGPAVVAGGGPVGLMAALLPADPFNALRGGIGGGPTAGGGGRDALAAVSVHRG